MMQTVKRAIACLFILIGGFGIPTALLSLASPFSESVSLTEAMLLIGVYIIMLVIGIWIAISGRRETEHTSTNKQNSSSDDN